MKTIATIAAALLLACSASAAVTQLNVLSFGARANNSAFDNRAAFSNAVTAAKSLGGGTVYAPAGTYWMRGPIPGADANVTIIGDSSLNAQSADFGTIIKLANGANASLVHATVNTRINLKGILFDGNRDNQTADATGIWFDSSNATIDRSSMENCIVQNVRGIGIRLDAREIRIHQTKVQNCSSHGIYNTGSADNTFVEILSGFNDGYGVVFHGANAARMTSFDLYRNGLGGLLLTNASNNLFVGGKTDANVMEGAEITSGPGLISYRNEFIGVAFVKNNFFIDQDGNPTPVPSGTYSNLKLGSDLTLDNVFSACWFWEAQDVSELGVKPKYLFEDARPYYLTNNFIGSRTFIKESHFTTDTNYWVTSYAQSNIVRYCYLDSFLDGSRWFTDNTYLRSFQTQYANVTDQLETLNGVQVNAFYGPFSTTNNWQYRQTGPAYYMRARQDNPIFGVQYAPSGTISNLLTWTTAFNINSTNGWVGMGLGDTPAVKPLEVMGDMKAATLESNGASFNAYYDGADWRYRTDGYAYYIQAQATHNQFVVFTAPLGSADAVITFIPAIVADETGAVELPVSVTSPLLTLATLNTSTLNLTNYIKLPLSVWSVVAGSSGETNRMFFDNTGVYMNGAFRLRSTAAGSDVVTMDGTTLTATLPVTFTSKAQFDANATAGETRMLLWDVDAGSLKRVSVGANDSGGAGFKLLRVAN